MSQLDLRAKLAILADAAKYDASCASSGTSKRNSAGGKGIGSTEGVGICHAYAPDGRCISLLKILLTNSCVFDCHYCINRKSSNVRRARFTPEEVVDLTLNFYRRNYIEGLFLSSGIIRSSDYTMEQIVRVAQLLREVHDFRGYIHLKTIPDADPGWCIRPGSMPIASLSMSSCPPSPALPGSRPKIRAAHRGRDAGCPRRDRRHGRCRQALQVRAEIRARRTIDPDDRRRRCRDRWRHHPARRRALFALPAPPRLLFGVQPDPDASAVLPLQRPPLMREHRLYQSDWLMRFYDYKPREVAEAADPATGMLPLDIDPKLAWALKFRDRFPVDVNRAPREALLRVPGLGIKAIDAILATRRWRRLRLADVARLTTSIAKVRPFLIAEDWRPVALADRADLRALVAPKVEQLELFAA
jgi:predicted DNA-binding helix-hairpin-helix protein